MKDKFVVIGSNCLVTIEGTKDIPAKIDTGADSSSVHVENLEMTPDGVLEFNLFSKDGKRIRTRDYKVAVVRSSNGDEELRYRTHLTLEMAGKTIRANFSLSDRSRNNFPVLIGRKTIKGKFLVDVSKREVETSKHPKTAHFNKELQENPFKFHEKYVKSTTKRNKERLDETSNLI